MVQRLVNYQGLIVTISLLSDKLSILKLYYNSWRQSKEFLHQSDFHSEISWTFFPRYFDDYPIVTEWNEEDEVYIIDNSIIYVEDKET